METVNVSNFRNNMAAYLDSAKAGQTLLLLRGTEMYTIMSVQDKDLVVTADLQEKINAALAAHREGRGVVCKTDKEIEDYLNSL